MKRLTILSADGIPFSVKFKDKIKNSQVMLKVRKDDEIFFHIPKKFFKNDMDRVQEIRKFPGSFFYFLVPFFGTGNFLFISWFPKAG